MTSKCQNGTLEILLVEIYGNISTHKTSIEAYRFMLRRCVLLFQRKADDYVEVKLELYELDVTSVESKANYAETKY